MIISKHIAAIALALAVGVSAAPSFAKSRARTMSAARAAAMRECNAKAAPYILTTWDNWQLYIYRACMAERGQAE